MFSFTLLALLCLTISFICFLAIIGAAVISGRSAERAERMRSKAAVSTRNNDTRIGFFAIKKKTLKHNDLRSKIYNIAAPH